MRKIDIVEDLGNAVTFQNAQLFATDYKKSLNKNAVEIINTIEKGDRPKLSSIKGKILLDKVNIASLSSYLIGQVQLMVLDPRNKDFKELKELTKIYSIKNPRVFAIKTVKLATKEVKPNTRLNTNEMLAYGVAKKVVFNNKELIRNLVTDSKKALDKINREITKTQTKQIIKRKSKLTRERIVVNGVKRPLTNEEIAKRLRGEFLNNNAKVDTIISNEAHRQQELVKEVAAAYQGYKWKIWNTQRDSKVRSSHAKLDKKIVRMTTKFNVGGHKADYPSDPSLPVDESINCRCFLTYE